MFRSSKPSPLFLGAMLVLAFVIVFFIFSNSYTQIYTQNSANSSSSQSASFSTGPASWIITPTKFSDKIIHYSLISSSYAQDGNKNQNDGSTKGDIWSQMDANGHVIKFHGIYTSLDGKTFLQEDYEDTSEQIIVFAKSTLDASQRLSPQGCIVRQSTPPSGLSDSLRIPFVNEVLLKENGSRMSVGTPTRTIPITTSLSTLKPRAIYGASSSSSVHIWKEMEHYGTGKEMDGQTLEVDSQGRLLVSGSESLNASNVITNSTWQSYGSLYVYNLNDVPTSVFSTAQQILAEGCIR
jgi:hypothetical protein